jgi:uncharacterized protein (DUF2062 family)
VLGEGTIAALAVIGIWWWLVVLFVERRRRLASQVDEVKARLTRPTKKPTYKVVVQMNSNGSLVSFKSLFMLNVGEAVTVDLASGTIRSYVPGALMVGLVVASEVVFE